MASNPEVLICPIELGLDDIPSKSSFEAVIEFYDEAGSDYEYWSKGLNMHLGFYRWGMDPFAREAMLEQLNLEVAARLMLDPKDRAFLIDLGCGAGAIARTVAGRYANATIKGITIVPSQVETATRLNTLKNLESRIEIIRGDYASTPFADGVADGVWAVESACYAQGSTKENLAREMARVLKTGGRFVVADCFVKDPEKKLNYLAGKYYSAVCRYWALPEMPELEGFVAALKRQGFTDVVVEDISWRVAPSLAHAPFAVMGFIVKKLFAGERLNRHSINNLKASLLAIALGLNRAKFSYCLVSGRAGVE
jgi:cyclopropane fatty-acyl-phospholipid synthase-like methyltransferase